MPRSLDLDRLRRFEPEPSPQPAPPHLETKAMSYAPAPHPIETPERWPSREAVRDGQVSIKAPLDVIERFRAMCRDDRRTYADMLGILMDAYEDRR
jgi:hypothetical protein